MTSPKSRSVPSFQLYPTQSHTAQSSNPLFTHDRNFAASDRLSKVLTAIIGPSITVLSLVKDAGSVIPVPWIQGVIGGVINLLNAVKVRSCNILCFASFTNRLLANALKLRRYATDCSYCWRICHLLCCDLF